MKMLIVSKLMNHRCVTMQGDGNPWIPALTVKGGTSGFYRIKVGK